MPSPPPCPVNKPSITPTVVMDAFIITCLLRGEEIAEYEPLVLVEHDGGRETSLVKEPELRDRAVVLAIHACCGHRASTLATGGAAKEFQVDRNRECS